MSDTHRRRCFMVLEDQRDAATGQFIPSAVFEGENGQRPLIGNGPLSRPWLWGKTWEEAQKTCAAENARLGLSEEDVHEIITSSFRASFQADAAADRYAEITGQPRVR